MTFCVNNNGILKDQPCEYRFIDINFKTSDTVRSLIEYVKASYLSGLQDHSPQILCSILALYLSAPKYLIVIH